MINKWNMKNVFVVSAILMVVVGAISAHFYTAHAERKARDLYYTQELYRFNEHESCLMSCWLGKNEYGISMDREEFYSEYKENNQDIEKLKQEMREDGYSNWEIKKIELKAQQVLADDKEFHSKYTEEEASSRYFESPSGRLLHPEGKFSKDSVAGKLAAILSDDQSKK